MAKKAAKKTSNHRYAKSTDKFRVKDFKDGGVVREGKSKGPIIEDMTGLWSELMNESLEKELEGELPIDFLGHPIFEERVQSIKSTKRLRLHLLRYERHVGYLDSRNRFLRKELEKNQILREQEKFAHESNRERSKAVTSLVSNLGQFTQAVHDVIRRMNEVPSPSLFPISPSYEEVLYGGARLHDEMLRMGGEGRSSYASGEAKPLVDYRDDIDQDPKQRKG